jgi:small subunit ribosomal protein S16
MSAVIRLSRFGKRHHPIYRVVVADNRKSRDGQFIEQVGFYDPHPASAEIRFEMDTVMKGLGVGAQPSDTVRSLLRKQGIMDLFHAKKAGRDITGKTPAPRAAKTKKKQLSPKAKARLEAEKASKEAPPAAAEEGA